MPRSFLLRISAIVLLSILAVLLFMDVVFTHQSHPITTEAIKAASSEASGQVLAEERDARERRIRNYKTVVGTVLVIDVTLLLYVATSFIRRKSNAADQ